METADEFVPARIRPGMFQLHQASELARDTDRDLWDFAVEVGSLREAGLRYSELRWLVCKAFVEHARETTRLNADKRSFQRTGELTFTDKTCFVLTQMGQELARNMDLPLPAAEPPGQTAIETPSNRPVWDVDRYELRWQGQLVKKYSVPSPNQRMVLMAFEEEGWPCRIDDPLPQHPDLEPKRRLHDTIKSLNRHQQNRLLRFLGDGTGEGVRWEPADSP